MKNKNLFIPVTEEFHQTVKEYCIKKKVSIQDLVTGLVLNKINREEKRHAKQS